MKVLVVSVISCGVVSPNLNNIMSAAQMLSAPIDILLLGAGDINVCKYESLNQVFQIQVADDLLLATNLAKTIAKFASGYTHVLMAADGNGKDILPRVAGVLDVGQISEVTKICSPNIFKRPIYAGNIIAEVESFDDIKLLTVRPTSFPDAKVVSTDNIESTKIEEPVFASDKITKLSTTYSEQSGSSGSVGGLALAKKIVSGGKSLESKENFDKLIRGLASKMNASVGASRDAVEAGFINNDSQVGQTGKVVAPNLYVAVGISGAVQHIAGMKDSKVVLAINIDPTAQIFEYADYGFEGDLFEVVPQLIEKL